MSDTLRDRALLADLVAAIDADIPALRSVTTGPVGRARSAIATPAALRDRAALLNALADLAGHISDLHDDAARLALPSAVTVGLQWLRDDAVTVVTDAKHAMTRETVA
jgi:hypothetical protein